MMRAFAISATLALLCLGISAQANVFDLGTASDGTVFKNLETVLVGDPGNVADTRYTPSGYGSVGYTYSIGKYEVTAMQYADFLNNKAKVDPHGLYNVWMWDDNYGCKIQRSGISGNYTYSVANDWANRPVNYVDFWDACRFVNWIQNGQGTGDTETGAYTLDGYSGDDGRTIQRNAGAAWFLPTEDEWYKAAYYKGGGSDTGYWDYPTRSNVAPSNRVLDQDPGYGANYYSDHENNNLYAFSVGSPYFRTNVGEFENSQSPYYTFDQGGNVSEWNEAIPHEYPGHANRGLRGGWFGQTAPLLRASGRGNFDPTYYDSNIGFRVATVPEPSPFTAFAGVVGLLAMRRRLVPHRLRSS